MTDEFRKRVVYPVIIPVGILVTIGGVVALFAYILLYNTRLTAILLAFLIALGILIAFALAASRDRLDPPRRAAVVVAGATPVVIGLAVALGLGAIPPEDLNINREPFQVIPEDAPVIVAENARDFEAEVLVLPAGARVTLVFDNQDDVPHNWTMKREENADAIIAATPTAASATLTTEIPGQEPGEYFFLCTIHPNMTGTVRVTEDVEEPRVGTA